MITNYIISKESNHFFFVQNLAQWHFSCRSEYNQVWLEKVGSLSDPEKDALAGFAEVLKKYDFDQIDNPKAANAYDFFMRFSDLEDRRPFSEAEIDIYMQAMETLRSKFETIWIDEVDKFGSIRDLLKSNDITSQINFDLEKIASQYVR
ncbi:MAG: hypothetical protein NTW50_00670 [Candidatus Berkelbacteria bacterium]|nr:hypothetical protein [Candidatus Berkelbacteria bacterium]